MAAISAAEGGADVILVDADPRGTKRAANTLFEGMASAAGINVEESYINNELDGMQIISPSGRALSIAARGYFLDRQKFDEHYFGLAQSSGVAILPGTVQEAKLQGTRRVVRLEEERIDARVVIDASGVAACLARQEGLEPMRHREDIAWAMEADIELPGLGEERLFQYWIGSMAPGWKATFSPAGGDRATLGVFVRGHGDNVQPFFRSFLIKFKAFKARHYHDIEELKILSIRRGGDPIAVLPGEIVADSLMVTGGAAGQSGLAYSMRAGSLCGSVAAQAAAKRDVSRRFLSRYVKLWNREFYWQYRMGRASLQTLAGMKDAEIDRLVKGLSGRRLIFGGSFARKATYAGAAAALSRPKIVLDLGRNLMHG
jgi:digeranylgeranylglycerophospholipid reductase